MELRFELRDIDKLKRAFDPAIVQRAQQSAIRKTTRKLRTELSKRVRMRYNVAANVVAKHTSLDTLFARPDNPMAILKYVGGKIGLVNFGATKRIVRGVGKSGRRYKRTGVSVRVLKGEKRKILRSVPGFIAKGENDNVHIFYRTGDTRGPIVSVQGPSVAEMVGRHEVMSGADTFLSQELPKSFSNELEFFLLRKVGLR